VPQSVSYKQYQSFGLDGFKISLLCPECYRTYFWSLYYDYSVQQFGTELRA